MCWFYTGIAQIALDPPASVKQANMEKKVPQTILVGFYTPPPSPLTGNAHGINTFQKGASLRPGSLTCTHCILGNLVDIYFLL